ncbi:hypothetical protein BKA66DRAFT_443641 [Pyrenochaeta sp. MPI-SDFR-AT-0127]|nr:hypothetical protein BKA66DRAFT_443641 [Pyrenochaeta sp. MPI-SDFR-AT-0127]
MDPNRKPSDPLTPEALQYLANTPVVPPPPGITSNFINPATRAPLQIWVTSILLVISMIFYLNRVYIKARLMRSWTWDDVTLLLAVILGVADYGLKTYGVREGWLGRHLYDIPMLKFMNPDGPRYYYTIFVLGPWIYLFLKATFFLLYLHIFGRIRWARISSWIGFGFVVISHGVLGIYGLAVANPRENASWTKYALGFSVPIAVFGLVADIAIFVIPYIAIAPLQLSSTKRVGASIIFLTGASAIICSVLNIYYRNKTQYSKNANWDATLTNIVGLAEVFLGITCACVPTVAYGFRHSGSVYQKIFRPSTYSNSRAQYSHPPTSIVQRKDFELVSITSKSHIYSHAEAAVSEPEATLQHERSTDSLDVVVIRNNESSVSAWDQELRTIEPAKVSGFKGRGVAL